ncbi:GAF and ANTAR domain-containing protein [Catenuloplanes indicus]|uniref:GAF domain-containing protein n=1 Tax=Catenuloplanes indicus TaxID=137267 RepID=A0AAE4AYK0_9ACTN|nr:GAF and ANTAR domain-containing protein [Catenuloplanes indicus]MDQ0366826.1 GAF domain-containing protein [Catenuloplanes indicus]
MATSDPIDPEAAFARLARIKLGETDLRGVLDMIADLARRAVPGADEVSVTLVRGQKPQTAALTSDMALRLDQAQYELGSGPCLEAAGTAGVMLLSRIATETRWPRWTPRAVELGAGSSLSIGLPVQESVTGALNVYSTTADAFDDPAVRLAESFAEYAAVALANAHLYDTTTTLAEQMRAAMAHRAVIEQAKGIIMADRRCTADEAFRILTRISQDTNRKLRDVAAALVAQAPRSS